VTVLGIETSCDDCSAAVVVDGKKILSNIVNSQTEIHKAYDGVVPELASRAHVNTISAVVRNALEQAGLTLEGIDGIAVTSRPGLIGSLLVGLCFAKGLSAASGKVFVGVDHILAHLYAVQLERDVPYPHIGLLVSGGHSLLTIVKSPMDILVKGITIDDACGEAFDKVAKHLGLGYPGGIAVQNLAAQGDESAYLFPLPKIDKGPHRYDVSYSGLKTAVINQLEQFRVPGKGGSDADIAASFQKRAVDILLSRLKRLVDDTGIRTVVAGGGVAANVKLRESAAAWDKCRFYFPSLGLCADNAAMVAGLGYHYLNAGIVSSLDLNAESRTLAYKK
jgi:N6-L-threonylcarbamoyladenine synthase